MSAGAAAIADAFALKALDRAGWLRVGVARPESVAAHSWGVALLCLLTAPPHLDRGRLLAYAILHDLAEARTGDLTPHDGVPRDVRHHNEAAAMRALCASLPNGAEIEAIWWAYERQQDEESRFVKQLDRLDMATQAAVYAAVSGDPAPFRAFLASADPVVRDPSLRPLLEAAGHQVAYDSAPNPTA